MLVLRLCLKVFAGEGKSFLTLYCNHERRPSSWKIVLTTWMSVIPTAVGHFLCSICCHWWLPVTFRSRLGVIKWAKLRTFSWNVVGSSLDPAVYRLQDVMWGTLWWGLGFLICKMGMTSLLWNCWEQHLCTRIHGSIIHGSLKVEAAQVSIDR